MSSSDAALRGVAYGVLRVLAPLGAGGIGEVYRSKGARLGREVALKAIWMPDGWHAVVRASEGGRGTRLYVVDTDTGSTRATSEEGTSPYGGGVYPTPPAS